MYSIKENNYVLYRSSKDFAKVQKFTCLYINM